jgi:hypothetical protein
MAEELKYDNTYFGVMGPAAGVMVGLIGIFIVMGWMNALAGYEKILLGVVLLIVTAYPLLMTGGTNERLGGAFMGIYMLAGLAEAIYGIIILLSIWVLPFLSGHETTVIGIIFIACGIGGLVSKSSLKAKALFAVNIILGLTCIFMLDLSSPVSYGYLFIMIALNMIFVGIATILADV